MPILFAVTLFLSALLLFMVQPMVGRMILPLLGGSPAAWNTCMVFFQFVLLLGYLYAHKLTARLRPVQQVYVHIAVIGLAIAAMALAAVMSTHGSPIAIVKSLAPQNTAYPMFGVLALLSVAIGLPFFAVSTSAPLLQRWFVNTGHPAGKDPYFLYAASNAGSLLSLFLYPMVAEPKLTLKDQAWLFAGGFVGLGLLAIVCGWAVLGAGKRGAVAEEQLTSAPPPSTGRIVKWIAYAFVPSSLMLGVTFYMTTDIASIPLLWVIPLAIYLLTFIIAFMRTPAWVRVLLGNVAPVVTLLLLFVIITLQPLGGPFYLIALHLAAFFFLALMCHLELAHDRPPPQYLTNYFLWISVGGVLGGIFNALLAPVLFSYAYEYTITLCLGCLLVPKFGSETPRTGPDRRRLLDFLIPLIMLVAVANLTAASDSETLANICEWVSSKITSAMQALGVGVAIEPPKVRDGILWALPLIICFFFIDRPLRFGLCVAAVVFVGEFRRANFDTHSVRSFFGILRIQELRGGEKLYLRSLVHGTTLHGKQAFDPWPLADDLRDPLGALVGPVLTHSFDWHSEPITYYSRKGPVGHLFEVTRMRHKPAKVAMVGLGTGSVSCYADPDLDLTFYEIDPTVKRLVADTDDFFTYVGDARRRGARVDIVVGDARLKLEEDTRTKYDMLLIDAFSSDSIPVHLLTKEAMQLYFDRLTPNGLLALHISNKYVKLDVVVARLAAELGATAYEFNDNWEDRDGRRDEDGRPLGQYCLHGKTQSTWVVLAKDPKLLDVFRDERFTTSYRYMNPPMIKDALGNDVPKPPPINEWKLMTARPGVKPWTDDYADVLMVMMLPQVQKLRHMFGLPTLEELRK